MSLLLQGEKLLEIHRERMLGIRPAIQALEAEIARLKQKARPDGVDALLEEIRKVTNVAPAPGEWGSANGPLIRVYAELEEL